MTDSTRVKIPFGIAQVGKSFRNEITPRNFTFRSREFEQMEIEFFCHPTTSRKWYEFWRDRRIAWYKNLGLSGDRLQLREHGQDELSHYSVGTADIEYAFPFLAAGEFGELEGIAHRGDFDLRSRMEGKLAKNAEGCLELEMGETEGKKVPKHKGSGRDLTYRDDARRAVHAARDRALGRRRPRHARILCEAYHEDQAPDDKGDMQTRTVMKFHPRIALSGRVSACEERRHARGSEGDLYGAQAAICDVLRREGSGRAAVSPAGRSGHAVLHYRRWTDVAGPDGYIRDRDTLEQWRVKSADVVEEIAKRVEA